MLLALSLTLMNQQHILNKVSLNKPIKVGCRDFHGGPMVKTSPSNAGGVGSIPGQGAKIPHASGPKPKT